MTECFDGVCVGGPLDGQLHSSQYGEFDHYAPGSSHRYYWTDLDRDAPGNTHVGFWLHAELRRHVACAHLLRVYAGARRAIGDRR